MTNFMAMDRYVTMRKIIIIKANFSKIKNKEKGFWLIKETTTDMKDSLEKMRKMGKVFIDLAIEAMKGSSQTINSMDKEN